MENLIAWLEKQIEGCNDLGGMEKEKWAFIQTLKKVRKERKEQLTIPNVVEPKGKLEMFQNMQYYMEHCQREGYITPQDWLEKEKHF